MTAPPDIAHRWTWTGDRDLPDWLTRHHHWDAGQLVIRTPDGDTRPQPGWWLIAWTDDTVTAASPTSGARVYGNGGITDQLAHAQAALAGVRALRARWIKAGPPPLGTSVSRWWDRRLVELGAVLRPEEQPTPD